MNVELKKVHQIQGDETPCFNAEVWADGKKVAHVRNDGHGGCCMWDWTVGQEIRDALQALAAERFPHPAAMDGYPVVQRYWYSEVKDQLVYGLLDDLTEQKWLKRKCKASILFRKAGEVYERGVWSEARGPYTPALGEALRRRFGAATIIANERF